MNNSWLVDWIVSYVKANGPAVAVKIVKEVVLPFAREQAARTGNKLDDYFVRQLDRILADPEFVALLEGIG